MSKATRARKSNKSSIQLSLSNASDSEEVAQNGQLTQLMKKFDNQMKQQREGVKQLQQSYEFMSECFDKLQAEIINLTKENKEMKRDIKKLLTNEKSLNDRIANLEQIAVKGKQCENVNNMIISNMPKLEQSVDLKNAICKIAEQVGYQLQDDEIVQIYQTHNKKFDTHPIIVKMTNDKLKSKCMQYRKQKHTIDIGAIGENLNTRGKNINFHHMIEREFAELLQKAKEAAKKVNFKYVWFKDNRVLVRKNENATVIQIKSAKDITKIK